MKIAQIVCTYPPYQGGIGNSAKTFARVLNPHHKITTFTIWKKEIPESLELPNTERLKSFLRYGHGALLPQLFWRLRKYDTIFLHFPFFGTAEIIWLYKFFCPKKKLVIYYHMDTPDLKSWAKILSWPNRLITNSLFNQAETILCSSLDYVKNGQIKKYYSQHPNKFHEIPFAVDDYKFHPKSEEFNTSLLSDHKKILFVGGLDKAHYFKGLDILLRASSLLPKNINWRLNIVGEGELKETYQNLAHELKIGPQVNFLGRAQDLPKIYRHCDLFVLPSINSHEAFGIVLIEAMASGLPVISSNLPGVRSVYTNGQEGLSFEIKNVEDLKEKMQMILENDESRKKMGTLARKLVLEKYSFHTLEKNLLAIFKNEKKIK